MQQISNMTQNEIIMFESAVEYCNTVNSSL